ncbi:MAG: hypothetical protein V1494_07255 [Candidatus Diapherotrites archaeon]
MSKMRPTVKPLKPFTLKEFRHGAIAYTCRARNFLRRNKGIISDFLEGRKALEGKHLGAKIKIGGLTVKRLKISNLFSRCFLVARGRSALFVKERNIPKKRCDGEQAGTRQMAAMRAAQRILADNGIQPIQYQLAVENRGRSFLVAGYYNFKTVSEIKDPELNKSLRNTILNANKQLIGTGVYDLTAYNCFYDPKRGKIIAFDLDII